MRISRKFIAYIVILATVVFGLPEVTYAKVGVVNPNGDSGVIVVVNGDQIIIVNRIELWGAGVWKDPDIASRWKHAIETVWNNGSPGNRVKYKCYDVRIVADVRVFPQEKYDPSEDVSGTLNYNEIWVPDLATGDLANTYNAYGLYTPGEAGGKLSYGEYDPETAAQYYESSGVKTMAYIGGRDDIGSDKKTDADWGTIPNKVSTIVLAHEVGHVMGIGHDENCLATNLMSSYPTNSGEIFPKYFKTMLDDIGLQCEWTVRSEVDTDGSQQTYIPVAFTATNEFTVIEESQEDVTYLRSTAPTNFNYEWFEDTWASCYTMSWKGHPGKVEYKGHLAYNLASDLKTGGRLVLVPYLATEPKEELLSLVTGATEECSFVNSYIEEVEDSNFHVLANTLQGEDATAIPYPHNNKAECPAVEEAPLTSQYYTDGFVIEGAQQYDKANHFPVTKVHFDGYESTFNIFIDKAKPVVGN